MRASTLLAIFLAACSGSTVTDAGPGDAGPSDFGPHDTGAADTGAPDLGAPDLGPTDLGTDLGACAHADADGDGHAAAACGGDDCDDTDPNRFPGNPEVCDAANHDEDCDPTTYGSRDVDGDGHVDIACCNVTSTGTMHCGDDCNDMSPTIHPLQGEICNGVDDDCDGMVDDIVPGTVICRAGDTRPCTTGCGGAGLSPCNGSCLGWDLCAGPETCNGCDDDNDGAVDNGFTCARASVGPCIVPACGTMGLHTCDGMCNWGACTATEICNYCDDNGDGNFNEERPLATATASTHFSDCSGSLLYGTATDCSTTPTSDGFELWATLTDGSANDQAGALWFDPGGLVQGWGATTVDVEVEATAITAGGMYEMPLGGWAVIMDHGSGSGVGSPQAYGLPATASGVGARWCWSTFDSSSSTPPYHGDSARGFAPGMGLREASAAPDWGLFSGDLLYGGSPGLDGPGTTLTQHIQLVYTPDDPTTPANEEVLQVNASVGGVLSPFRYHPAGAQPIGTSPLSIGITAGSYTQSGFSGPPAGAVFGVPVRVRVHVFTQHTGTFGRPTTFDFPQTISRTGLCP